MCLGDGWVQAAPDEYDTADMWNDLDTEIKVEVPTGTVRAVKKSDPSFIVWQRKVNLFHLHVYHCTEETFTTFHLLYACIC